MQTLGIHVYYGKARVEDIKGNSKVLSKKLLLEEDIVALHSNGKTELCLDRFCIITPLAMDKANELGIRIERA